MVGADKSTEMAALRVIVFFLAYFEVPIDICSRRGRHIFGQRRGQDVQHGRHESHEVRRPDLHLRQPRSLQQHQQQQRQD